MNIGHNPMNPESIVTLLDGVSRRICFDLNATIMMQKALGLKTPGDIRNVSDPEFLRAALWAGCFADAMERKEDGWTLEKVGTICKPGMLAELLPKILELFRDAMTGGLPEKQASLMPGVKAATPSRGTGKKH